MSRTIKDMPLFVRFPDKYNGGPCRPCNDLGIDYRSLYGGAKCHCHMCGVNVADKFVRSHYWKAGLKPGEHKPGSEEKRQDRRKLRFRERRFWQSEVW